MKKVLFLGMSMLLLINCSFGFGKNKVKGSGTITSESRQVSPFTGLDAAGIFTVYLSQGDRESVTVEIDDNLQQYVSVCNKGQMLVLGTSKEFNNRTGSKSKVKVYVTLKNIERLEVSGVCTVKGQTPLVCDRLDANVKGVSNCELEIRCSRLEITQSGVCNIRLTGETGDCIVKKDGVGSLKASGLHARNMSIRNSGVGNVELYASGELSLNNSGVGSIKYSGDAVITSLNSSGVGKIRKAE